MHPRIRGYRVRFAESVPAHHPLKAYPMKTRIYDLESTLGQPKAGDITFEAQEELIETTKVWCSEDVKVIRVVLNTEGGDTDAGIKIFEHLRDLSQRGIEIITHNKGTVASVGNVVFAAGDVRLAKPNSKFLFHGVAKQYEFYGTDPSLPTKLRFGKEDLEEFLKEILENEKRLTDVYRSRYNFDSLDINTLFRKKARRFGLREAKDFDIITAVAG